MGRSSDLAAVAPVENWLKRLTRPQQKASDKLKDQVVRIEDALTFDDFHRVETSDVPDILQGGAPKIAKLVYNSNNYGLWYL